MSRWFSQGAIDMVTVPLHSVSYAESPRIRTFAIDKLGAVLYLLVSLYLSIE
jgi:hypothetical protein